MNVQNIKQAIANRLLQAYNEGRSGMVSMEGIDKELGVSSMQVAEAVSMMHQQGVLTTIIGGASAKITPYGVEVLEPRDIAVPKQPPQTVNNNFQGSNFSQSAISTGDGTASVSVQQTEVNNYFEKLEKAIDQADNIPPEQKRSWKKSVWEMSKHPALAATLSTLLG